MSSKDIYYTIKHTSEGQYRDKASKFIAKAFPVKNEEEVKQILADLKKQYWDANHHCYAYLLKIDKSVFRTNDDGEPSGTAGRPILGQLNSKNLTNTLIVVLRYFGGTKLGVSGLINAYKNAACNALDNAEIIQQILKDYYEIKFGYELMNDVMRIIKEKNLERISHEFLNSCSLIFSVRKSESPAIPDLFSAFKGLSIRFLETK